MRKWALGKYVDGTPGAAPLNGRRPDGPIVKLLFLAQHVCSPIHEGGSEARQIGSSADRTCLLSLRIVSRVHLDTVDQRKREARMP